jgi:hypothetical protein
MRGIEHLKLSLALITGLSGLASAQSSVSVVNGLGSNLQQAIDAAFEGDILIVQGGPYSSLHIDGKSLTVLVDAGHEVVVNAPLVVRNLAAGQTVLVRGFQKILDVTPAGHRILDNAGTVWIEDCKLTLGGLPLASFAAQSVRIANSDAVVLADCLVTSDQIFATDVGGLAAEQSAVALFGCELLGGKGAPGAGLGATLGTGGVAARVTGGFMHLERCTVKGGTGANGILGYNPVTGAVVCSDGSAGGHGLVVDGAGTLVEAVASEIAGGPGGAAGGAGCSPGTDGLASLILGGALQTPPCPAPALAVEPSPAIGGSTTVTVAVSGSPGDLAAVIYGPPLFLALAPACGVALAIPAHHQFLGVVDAAGGVAFSFVPPAYVPGLGQTVLLQAAVFSPSGGLAFGGAATLTMR